MNKITQELIKTFNNVAKIVNDFDENSSNEEWSIYKKIIYIER